MSDQLARDVRDDTIAAFRYLQGLAEGALDQVDDDAFFQPLDDDANSLAIVVKHMGGNLRSRFTDFLTTDGEKSDRHRDREFERLPGDTRDSLMAAWRRGWGALYGALEPLTASDLERTVTIRAEPHTVVRALQRALGHAAYHVGQIVLLARHQCGPAWRTLSIPRGGSEAYNAGRLAAEP